MKKIYNIKKIPSITVPIVLSESSLTNSVIKNTLSGLC